MAFKSVAGHSWQSVGQALNKTTLDYRDHQVIAAYTPLANSDLGLVVKLGVAKLYAPNQRTW